MKIVIDIPENEYRYIKEIYEKNDIVEGIYSYIYHGTPLPEGHGRLIDADALYDSAPLCHTEEDGTACVEWREINNAPTIIEAEGSDSE